jgi:hypothetical protein
LRAPLRTRVTKRATTIHPIPTATHAGHLEIGGFEIGCAVLEGTEGRRQRVLTQSDFMIALGRARQAKGREYYDGDVNLPAFLTAKNLKPFIDNELYVTSSQIVFKTFKGTRAFGYPTELLPKVCEVFLKSRYRFEKIYRKRNRQASQGRFRRQAK